MSAFKDAFKENGKILLLALGLLVISFFGLFFMNKTNFFSNTGMENITNKGENTETANLPDYKAVIKTNMGDIQVDLFEKETPKTVENFVSLSKKGFYNGLTFHRIVKTFVIQGGDPKGDGTGDPGYKFNDEITDRKFTKYSLAMANAGRNTNGSQFFITLGNIQDSNLRNLDGKYTLFGVVTSGQDIVDRIGDVQTDEGDKPLSPVVMEEVTIIEE